MKIVSIRVGSIFIFNGALTNKPHAFKFRAWELETVKNFDLFDSLVEEILVETRGTDVLRILPVALEFPEYNWITDRSRFFFDSLKNQRVVEPLLFLKNDLFKLSWYSGLILANYFLFKIKQNSLKSIFLKRASNLTQTGCSTFNTVCFLENFNTDLQDFFSFHFLRKRLGLSFAIPLPVSGGYSSNESHYLLPSLKPFVAENLGLVFLIALDLRFELPKLNLFLRRQIKIRSLRVYTIGVRLLGLHKYNYINLGFSLQIFLTVLEGRHWVNNFLFKNQGIHRMFLGSSHQTFLNEKRFLFNLTKFCTFFNVKYTFLFSQVSVLNRSLLNFQLKKTFLNKNSFFTFTNNSGILVNLSCSSFFESKFFKNSLVLNLNPFFFEQKETANLSLPVSTFLERGFLTCNLLGKISKTIKVVNSPLTENGKAKHKTLSQIFEVFSAFLFLKTKKKTALSRFFFSTRKFLNVSCSSALVLKKCKSFVLLKNYLLNRFVVNFYKQEEFSKNSLVLNINSNVFYSCLSNYT